MTSLDLRSTALGALRAHWDTLADEAQDDLARVDTTRRSQWYRFEMFARHQALSGCSVLDVGCGMGDFYAYLQEREYGVDYCGIDLSEVMVARCQQRYPEARIEARDLLAWETEERWDHVTAFAVHNVRVDGAWELLKALTRRQFELCRVSTHLSLLTDRYQAFDSHIQPWSPRDVLDFAWTLTPWVALRHDYLPHDFSVTLYREPLADRDPIQPPEGARR